MNNLINKIKKYLIFCILVFSIINSQNRDCEVTIDEVFFNENIIGYYLSAIDINSGESNILLFDYLVDFSDCDISTLNNSLDINFDIKMYIPTFDSYSNGPESLASGIINLTNIPNDLNQLQFRNTDLSFETQYLQGGTEFSMEEYSVDISESDIEELTEIIMGQGKVPNGIYYFTFNLVDPLTGESFDSLIKEINVFVPSYLELISPGSALITDTLSNVEFTANPVFQWNSDYCSECEYFIRVCEFNPNNHSSLEEAIEDISVLPMESGFYSLNTSNVFQYPTTSVESLLPGKLYVWQIKRTFQTTNGIEEDLSELYLFKIQAIDTASNLDSSSQSELENIKLLIGENNFNQIFGNNGDLNGYESVKPMMIINNQDVSINYLLDLIQMNNNGEINIIEVEIE